MIKPKMMILEESEDLIEKIELVKKEEQELKGYSFSHGEFEKIDGYQLDVRNCKFNSIRCFESDFTKSYFSDVVFENCDFSNNCFLETTFARVAFVNCKMVGNNFSNNIWHQVSLSNVNANYINLSGSNIKDSEFEDTCFSYGSIQESSLKSVRWNHCSFIGTQFFKTKLMGMDFTNCEIDGIVIGIDDLPGAIVTQQQAVELSKLMKIIVK